MNFSDLEIAKNRLLEEGLTLVVVKDGKTIFDSGAHGISSFLEVIGKSADLVRGACVADKIVGKAVALLCSYGGVKAVYASVLSMVAKTTLEDDNVIVHWGKLVEIVQGKDETTVCPFEELARTISDPVEGYSRLRDLAESLRLRGTIIG